MIPAKPSSFHRPKSWHLVIEENNKIDYLAKRPVFLVRKREFYYSYLINNSCVAMRFFDMDGGQINNETYA